MTGWKMDAQGDLAPEKPRRTSQGGHVVPRSLIRAQRDCWTPTHHVSRHADSSFRQNVCGAVGRAQRRDLGRPGAASSLDTKTRLRLAAQQPLWLAS
jgi:hypothetical protein